MMYHPAYPFTEVGWNSSQGFYSRSQQHCITDDMLARCKPGEWLDMDDFRVVPRHFQFSNARAIALRRRRFKSRMTKLRLGRPL